MKGVVAAYGLSAAAVAAVCALIAVSPRDESAVVVAPAQAGTTSTTVAGGAGPGDALDDADNDGLTGADDPCPGDTRNACFGEVAVDGITGNPIRINAGSHPTLHCAEAKLDCNGDFWLADFGSRTPGGIAGCPERSVLGRECPLAGIEDVLGCTDRSTELVFRCGHRGKRHEQVAYDFDLAAGRYLVNFFFAAGIPRSPDRDGAMGVTISLNGTAAYTRFDPADAATATGEVIVRSAMVDVEADGLTIDLHGARKRTALRALEILTQAPHAQGEAGSSGAAGRDAPVTTAATATDDDKDGLAGTADPCPTDVRNRCVGPIAVDTTTGKTIRVNANISTFECTGAKTDCAGTVWNGDFGYNQSGKSQVCDLGGGGEGCVISGIPAIFGCDSEATEDIFQCAHSDPLPAPNLKYTFTVPNGKYVVNLFFANTAASTTAAGSRVFDILVEGATAYNNFDQVVAAGGSGKAVVRSAVTNVTDGNLVIEFGHEIEFPNVKAIEVYAYTSTGCTTAAQCNDGNACTNDACTTGTCTHTNNTAACTSDSNPCTNDVCASGACTHPKNTSACNDNRACTTNDVCSGGVCAGTSTCGTGQSCGVDGQCQVATDGDNDGLTGTNDPCPGDPRNLCAGPVATDTATGKKIRLNANASEAECTGSKTDCKGDTWLADFGYNQSAKSHVCDLGGGGEGCVISGISAIFGCDSESTEDLFQCAHSDPPGAPDLIYTFSVPNGRYLVNMYFANTSTNTTAAGSRKFDIRIEGALAYNDFDQVVAAGGSGKAVLRSAVANVTDGNLVLEFEAVVELPSVRAIEVLSYGTSPPPGCTSASQCNDNNPCTTDACNAGNCQHTNNTASCNDGIACTSGDVCSNGSCHGNPNCPAGQSCNTTTGQCVAASPISFGKSILAGVTLTKPTSLQFGPDGKLYVAQQDGLIKVYKVTRSGPNNYAVTASQTITSIQSIPNRNDDGTLNSSVTKRLVTGLLVAGTAANPVIYVGSSDPRIGGGDNATDTNLDTNSGILSRLTWNGSSWVKLDLVRGLPRSEENHASNGMALNTATNTLFIAQGGHTNEGAPSNNFVGLPEYALSAAILSVNLGAIGNTTYDIPTLDDESRSGSADANDPFGGNSGKNQARIVAGGPVQVYSPGWRNPYDVVIAKSGKIYAVDNGANAAWGDIPVGNGTSNCTNGVNEPGLSLADNLHLITGPGYYAGHPNPTRGNANNKFNQNNPQSPVPSSNSVECTFREPGVNDGALVTFNPSTNGLTEYTASNFGGQLKGDLLAAAWDNRIFRVDLNSAGTSVNNLSTLFSSVVPNSKALDITAQGDAGPFPGSIWGTDYNNGGIVVFEPADLTSCGGQDNASLDDDDDGFDNADEIDNGTNPCSAGDTPPDADGDNNSNLNDPDDDNDGQLDTTDPYARDAQNGKGTTLPVLYSWENGAANPGGIMNLGFTGLMTNGTSNYEALFNPDDMTASGAAGVLTVDMVPEGDAFQALNSQQYGFQFGLNTSAATPPFTVHTRIIAPFLGTDPADFQSMGLFIGNGRQGNYLKIVASANGGSGGVEMLKEINDVVTAGPKAAVAMPGPDAIDLYLGVNPASSTVQGFYSVTNAGVTGPLTSLGAAIGVSSGWFTSATTGPAVGILATSRGAAPPFAATWDFIEVASGQPSCSDPDGDGQCGAADPCPNDGLNDLDGDGVCDGLAFNAPKTAAHDNCPDVANGNQADTDTDGRGNVCDKCPLAAGGAEDTCLGTGSWTELAPTTVVRSEVGMASALGKNYLVGGQQSGADTLEIYNPANNTWATGPPLPAGRHHIQPVTVKGKIYVIGGLTGFPGPSLNAVLMFDPANAAAGWQTRASLPTSRGAAGCAADGIKIYCAGGLSSTAGNTAIAAMEVLNTVTNTWTTLAPMPHVRDHFQAVIVNGKFYAIGGRDTEIPNTIPFNDIYDITTNSWSSGASIPTERGGFSAVVVQGRILIISGEGVGPPQGTFPDVEEYDPVRNVWRSLADIPAPRHGSGAAMIRAADGFERVYIAAGGPNQGGSSSTEHHVFKF